MMDKFFKITERGSSLRKEIIGGLTTFFTMAYIIFVNPNILSIVIQGEDGSSLWTGIMVGTCIAAAIGCILTALLANVPFAQAPGMGLNAFFTYTVCFTMGYSWQQALSIVLISGVIFLIIGLSPLRGKIIASIPAGLKAAIGAGIGLFIAFIGLINNGAGIVRLDEGNNITGLNLANDGVWNNAAILSIIGLILIAVLMAWRVKGAIFIGIIATTLIGFLFKLTELPEEWTVHGVSQVKDVMFKFDFAGLFDDGMKAILPLVTAIVSFVIVDMFDTVGTLVGTAGNAGMLDKDGNLPGGDKAIIADAVATCAGSCVGTSTVTTYVESSAGISEGARTGFSSLLVGILFLLAIIIAPVAGIIPGAATAPALIIVGVLMMKSAAKVAWDDMEIAIPAFLTIAMMPFAYSISDGIGFGFISYTIIKMARGKFKEVPVLMYILTALFLLMYILKNR
ncbi:MAG: hypothetical protein CVU97_05980 [Firmicutes bacterium HGW-Firmicutes-21]|nr:MAG: hypothetical protein CVU97_05980 [Firmicutes bacterium HGW-Firmicutes-21]